MWSLTLRQEHKIVGVCEQGVEENICTYKEVAGGWRKLHNEELHNLYASEKIRVIK
jgi:hypothetical protein